MRVKGKTLFGSLITLVLLYFLSGSVSAAEDCGCGPGEKCKYDSISESYYCESTAPQESVVPAEVPVPLEQKYLGGEFYVDENITGSNAYANPPPISAPVPAAPSVCDNDVKAQCEIEGDYCVPTPEGGRCSKWSAQASETISPPQPPEKQSSQAQPSQAKIAQSQSGPLSFTAKITAFTKLADAVGGFSLDNINQSFENIITAVKEVFVPTPIVTKPVEPIVAEKPVVVPSVKLPADVTVNGWIAPATTLEAAAENKKALLQANEPLSAATVDTIKAEIQSNFDAAMALCSGDVACERDAKLKVQSGWVVQDGSLVRDWDYVKIFGAAKANIEGAVKFSDGWYDVTSGYKTEPPVSLQAQASVEQGVETASEPISVVAEGKFALKDSGMNVSNTKNSQIGLSAQGGILTGIAKALAGVFGIGSNGGGSSTDSNLPGNCDEKLPKPACEDGTLECQLNVGTRKSEWVCNKGATATYVAPTTSAAVSGEGKITYDGCGLYLQDFTKCWWDCNLIKIDGNVIYSNSSSSCQKPPNDDVLAKGSCSNLAKMACESKRATCKVINKDGAKDNEMHFEEKCDYSGATAVAAAPAPTICDPADKPTNCPIGQSPECKTSGTDRGWFCSDVTSNTAVAPVGSGPVSPVTVAGDKCPKESMPLCAFGKAYCSDSGDRVGVWSCPQPDEAFVKPECGSISKPKECPETAQCIITGRSFSQSGAAGYSFGYICPQTGSPVGSVMKPSAFKTGLVEFDSLFGGVPQSAGDALKIIASSGIAAVGVKEADSNEEKLKKAATYLFSKSKTGGFNFSFIPALFAGNTTVSGALGLPSAKSIAESTTKIPFVSPLPANTYTVSGSSTVPNGVGATCDIRQTSVGECLKKVGNFGTISVVVNSSKHGGSVTGNVEYIRTLLKENRRVVVVLTADAMTIPIPGRATDNFVTWDQYLKEWSGMVNTYSNLLAADTNTGELVLQVWNQPDCQRGTGCERDSFPLTEEEFVALARATKNNVTSGKVKVALGGFVNGAGAQGYLTNVQKLAGGNLSKVGDIINMNLYTGTNTAGAEQAIQMCQTFSGVVCAVSEYGQRGANDVDQETLAKAMYGPGGLLEKYKIPYAITYGLTPNYDPTSVGKFGLYDEKGNPRPAYTYMNDIAKSLGLPQSMEASINSILSAQKAAGNTIVIPDNIQSLGTSAILGYLNSLISGSTNTKQVILENWGTGGTITTDAGTLPSNPFGVRCDPEKLNGCPTQGQLADNFQKGGWVSIVYKGAQHNKGINYDKIINDYLDAGYFVNIIANQDTSDIPMEIADPKAIWRKNMTDDYLSNWGGVVSNLASKFKGKNVAFQIGAEMDNDSDGHIYLTAEDYASYLATAYGAIKNVSPNTPVVSGAVNTQYLTVAKNVNGGTVPADWVGFDMYAINGLPNLQYELGKYSAFGLPVSILEAGAVDNGSLNSSQKAAYEQLQKDLVSLGKDPRIANVLWYVWSDNSKGSGDQSGFGLNDANGNAKMALGIIKSNIAQTLTTRQALKPTSTPSSALPQAPSGKSMSTIDTANTIKAGLQLLCSAKNETACGILPLMQ